MLFQSQVPALFNQIGMDLYNSANSARKLEAAKKLNFYFDEQRDRLDEQLNELFSEPEKMVQLSLNIVKKIVDNLSQVYFSPPIRTLEDGTEKDEAIYKEILELSAFDTKMKQGQRLTKLCGTILIRPVWRNDAISLDVLTGNILDVETGDSPEILKRVLITDYGSSDRIEDVQYSLWTPEFFQRLDYRGNILEEEPNPYNILPFLPCFAYPPPSSSFWLSSMESLISIQESINLKITDLLYLIQQQSYGVGYIKGNTGGGSLKVDPGSLVELQENGEIGFRSQEAEIDKVVNAIDKLIKWAAVSYGLSAATMSTDPSQQSGISKAWDNKELSEMRADDVALWRTYEKQLFDIVRIVHNTHSNKKLSEKANLRIDFADPTKQSMTAKEQAEADELKITQGVLSSVDVLLRENPDFQNDREKALAHLLTLREEMRLLTE